MFSVPAGEGRWVDSHRMLTEEAIAPVWDGELTLSQIICKIFDDNYMATPKYMVQRGTRRRHTRSFRLKPQFIHADTMTYSKLHEVKRSCRGRTDLAIHFQPSWPMQLLNVLVVHTLSQSSLCVYEAESYVCMRLSRVCVWGWVVCVYEAESCVCMRLSRGTILSAADDICHHIN